ncbi:hypothetical protein A3H89_00340 [Candidatus Amesbacteria bacterium RIFCSPLOWO2_02_FULL_48_11]|uniref:Predicted DNA-binding protein ribbon-helix-helix domain-containing protein n=4 Tax=Candidatus Amesiibacteriota TaxID=1752730 RepID=A0A1F4Z850_9BACT|nr:MAG: hypothetical protein UX78_C0005G0066 [Candidatus Amesbacteria bacterium GW2011_GWA2_47_11]KKU93756.1 MAG: hypothetical protein UY22_C0017G0013 [Candidatus Amesbacteria bacterium GW2011_GWC1_48_10]KKU99550.1 MAG: hypothetical protein UY33_C0028G0004 [Candidatus Amesbacteria bacterium GW2011_GWA1_48_9]OGC90002.1 MAG: hypothetical protein A2V48_01175 [Candidatus Amesbacteria bacterium RBG_19FT_COMBO_48_16]OGC96209.1 MAG: hypothetical protein A3C34_02385 [Candidatus Amesbacteria bacterium R
MIRTQVYLPEEVHRDLKLLAKTERVRFSELVREGAEEVMKKRKARRQGSGMWREFVGALKYGPKDLSTRINEIYK